MKKIKRSGSLFYDDDDIDMMEIQVNLVIAIICSTSAFKPND